MTETRILQSKPYKNTTLSSKVIHALATRKGITWLDNVRIPYKSKEDIAGWQKGKYTGNGDVFAYGNNQSSIKQEQGRFPANLLVSGDVLNDRKIRKSCKSITYHKEYGDDSMFLDGESHPDNQYDDSGSYSRYFDLDKWWEKLND